jgi:hypothetical protein
MKPALLVPLSAFRIARANELVPGDFGFLHEFDNAPVLVGDLKEKAVVVFLEPTGSEGNSLAVHDLDGEVTVINEAEIEVDPLSLKRLGLSQGGVNSLIIKATDLFIEAVPPPGVGKARIRVSAVPEGSIDAAYECLRWRVVIRRGETETVLFQKFV